MAAGSSTDSGAKKLSPDDLVLFESDLSARIYKLNRPKQRNALNHDMISALRKQVGAWRDSDLCKIVIGTGDPVAFCAGGDVKRLMLDKQEGKDDSLAFFKDEFELNWALARLGKPYVAVMDGLTMGGGAGLALPAPIRIATSSTVFAMPETKIGYSPDVGAQYYLAQLDGNIGTWLAMTGQEVFGRAVYELGIATHYVSPTSVSDLLFQISQLPSPTLGSVSALVANYAPPPPTSADLAKTSSKSSPQSPSPISGEIRVFLDKTFGLKSVSEIYSALEGAESEDGLSEEVKTWAKIQKSMMEERSPTGMAVALEASKRAKKAKKLDRVLVDDMSMASAFSGPEPSTPDFVNGVTSLLIAKTKAEWSPSSISDPALTPKAIEAAFFAHSGPSLQLIPAPTSVNSSPHDSSWGKFRSYGLPAESEVKAIVEGSSSSSGAFAVKLQEILDGKLGEVVASASEEGLGSGGTRDGEVRRRVREIVETYCKTDKDGYLRWRGA